MDKGIVVTDMFIPIVAIKFAFGSPIVLVAAIVHQRMRKARLMHEPVARLLEKGQPVSEALLLPEPKSSRSDLRTGIILIGA